MSLRVWHISRECDGIAEAGGLKDVVAGLSAALAAEGFPTAVVLPRYGFIDLASLQIVGYLDRITTQPDFIIPGG